MPLRKDLYRRMSAKDWSERQWVFSCSGVENWLLLHIMCGTKRLNQFFRLHEASQVLNKHVLGVWQARRQDFAARGAKNHNGATFLNTILDVCSNPGPNMKWASHILNRRAGHHCPPTGDGPGVWSDSPMPFSLVSLWLFLFLTVPVADQICPPKMLTRVPNDNF